MGLIKNWLDKFWIQYTQVLETVANETKASPTVVAAALTEIFKSLRREGVEIQNVSDQQILELFGLIADGKAAKEAIPDVVSWLTKHEQASIKDALENLGLEMLSETQLEQLVDDLLKENKKLVEKSGKEAFGAMTGITMKKIRGKADAELVAKVSKKKLE